MMAEENSVLVLESFSKQEQKLLNRITSWRRSLYYFNAFTLVLGVALLVLALVALQSTTLSVFATRWLLGFVFLFGLCVTFVSAFGVVGAWHAESSILSRRRNWYLLFYILLVLAIIVAEILIAISVFQLVRRVAGLNEQSNPTVVPLAVWELTITEAFDKSRQTEWIEIQKEFKCCGYESATGVLATGEKCSDPNPTPCRLKLMSVLKDQAIPIAVVSVVILFIESLALLASIILSMVIQPIVFPYPPLHGEGGGEAYSAQQQRILGDRNDQPEDDTDDHVAAAKDIQKSN